jgi:hypothetical protein
MIFYNYTIAFLYSAPLFLRTKTQSIFALFVWLISHQPAVLFSQNKSAISNQPAVLFSQNKSAPATSQTNRLFISEAAWG